jgi:predicted nucleic acid-binding protein
VHASSADRVVLDTYAILALIEGEPAAQSVASILTDGEPWMTLVNLGEVTYIVERIRGATEADVIFANLLATERPDGGVPIRWLAVDERLVRQAASLKAALSMSYADAFAAAAARLLDCPVVTGDPEFAAVEALGIVVRWL